MSIRRREFIATLGAAASRTAQQATSAIPIINSAIR
jgi:hypothetical protein